jgi:hypothetical protein
MSYSMMLFSATAADGWLRDRGLPRRNNSQVFCTPDRGLANRRLLLRMRDANEGLECKRLHGRVVENPGLGDALLLNGCLRRSRLTDGMIDRFLPVSHTRYENHATQNKSPFQANPLP